MYVYETEGSITRYSPPPLPRNHSHNKQAVPPFRAVHASKGFTRMTGWHLHTLALAAAHDPQQHQQQGLAAALFPSTTNPDEMGQQPSVAALLAEAEGTGFGRAALWLQLTATATPAPFLCRVSVVPVLDRPVPASHPTARFLPRLTHLRWSFIRAAEAAGPIVGGQE